MLRRTACSLVVNLPYNTIIVGGGNAGCYLAHKLAMAGQRVALVEEGADIRSQPRWHYEVPCAQIAHRINKQGYEAMVTTTPQKGFTGDAMGAVTIPYPKVLGGSGVMGSKSWLHGDASDWEGTGFDFKKDIRVALHEVEGVDNPLPFRGKHGRFFVSRPGTTSPTYKAFSEAMVEGKQAYIIDYNTEKAVLPSGVGRPEVLIDRRGGIGHSTLRSYLMEATNLKRDVTVFANTRAMALEGKGGNVHGVRVVGKDKAETILEGRRVILAANPVNNAQLVLRSPDFAEQAAALPQLGRNFYDRPRVVLQYKALMNDTHQLFDSTLTRALALFDWQWRGKANAVTSSYDDMVCYWSPEGQHAKPSVKISMQPFAVDQLGKFNANADHALQFTIELLQPASRGCVTAASVDPNYYGDAEGKDRALMAEAVTFVKTLAKGAAFKRYLDAADPIAVLEAGSGVSGGTMALGAVTDGADFSVKGINGLFVCDSSVLPNPTTGATIATTLATSTLCGNRLLDSLSSASTIAGAAAVADSKVSHPGKVGGQDDGPSDQKYSSKVKVTYY